MRDAQICYNKLVNYNDDPADGGDYPTFGGWEDVIVEADILD